MKKIFFFMILSFCLLGEVNISKDKIEKFVSVYNVKNKTDLKFIYEEDLENKQVKLINKENNLFIIISNYMYTDLMTDMKKYMSESEAKDRMFQEIIKAHTALNYKIESDLDDGITRQVILKNEASGFNSVVIFQEKTKLHLHGSFPMYRKNKPYVEFFVYFSENFK